jgi:hypothetical protein
MSMLFGDATLLWTFQAFLVLTFCYAEIKVHGWFTKQTGVYVSVKRGEASWNNLDFAFGIMAVNVLQIINSADDTVKFKVLISAFDLGVMIRLFFFNGWSRNKIIGVINQARHMKEGTRAMPAQVRASHEADVNPPSV